ncbi:MAG: outer membrane protein transport protein, partial [Bacteroidota bacterium]
GVSFSNNNSINVGITPTIAKGAFLDANTNAIYRTTSPIGTPFSAYTVFGLKDSSNLKFGLGIYTPFGSTVQWEDKWTGRFALSRLKLEVIFIQPTVSYKISKKIGIGAGFVYSTGSVNLQKDIPLINTTNEFGRAELAGKANGIGYNLGVYFNAISKLTLGITYRSQVNMVINDGNATFKVPSSLEANFPNGKFISSLPLPKVITFGAGYKLNAKLQLALDINYVGWKAYDTLAFDYENNTSSLLDTKSVRNYKNTFAFRSGASYKPTTFFTTRLGLAFGITPVQNGYVTPETPDANRVNYTAGFSYQPTKHFSFDASILFTHLKRKDTNLETNLSGTFKTNVIAPGFSIIYNF